MMMMMVIIMSGREARCQGGLLPGGCCQGGLLPGGCWYDVARGDLLLLLAAP